MGDSSAQSLYTTVLFISKLLHKEKIFREINQPDVTHRGKNKHKIAQRNTSKLHFQSTPLAFDTKNGFYKV